MKKCIVKDNTVVICCHNGLSKYNMDLPNTKRVSVQSINSFSKEIITEMERMYVILNKRGTADASNHLQCLFYRKLIVYGEVVFGR